MINKFKGTCGTCGAFVFAGCGQVHRSGNRWKVYCLDCGSMDRRDNSSHEDRACGNSAYEDRCAERCAL